MSQARLIPGDGSNDPVSPRGLRRADIVAENAKPKLFSGRLSGEVFEKDVVAEVEVVADGARFEPHEGGGDSGVEEGDDGLGFFGGEGGLVEAGDDEVEEVLFAFELVPEGAESTSVGVGFDSDGGHGVLVGGSGELGVEVWEEDGAEVTGVVEDTGDDLVAASLFLGSRYGWVGHPRGILPEGEGGWRSEWDSNPR